VIELLDIGDRVDVGRYRLHSRFRDALIFAPAGPGRSIACVVDEKKGRGPLNIVARGLGLARADSMEVGPDRIILGETAAEIESRYDSSLPPTAPDPERFRRNLRVFERTLSESASPKSLAFLLDERRERNFASGFEKEFLRRARGGADRLLAGDLEGGAARLRGLGFGLTPSGDDFLAGFLLGLHALRTAFGLDLAKEIRAVAGASRSDNPLVDAFLLCAAEGRYFERAKALVSALLEGSEFDVVRGARGLMEIGASSGADLGVGLFLALAAAW